MKNKFYKIIAIIILVVFIMPAFAECVLDSSAEYASIYTLNKLIRQNKLIEQFAYLQEENKKIDEILKSNNPETFSKAELKTFGLNCMCRNERLLKDFREKYFLPSYNTYQSFDDINYVTFDEWISNAGLSNRSNLHEYYINIERNYNNCKNIYMSNK